MDQLLKKKGEVLPEVQALQPGLPEVLDAQEHLGVVEGVGQIRRTKHRVLQVTGA